VPAWFGRASLDAAASLRAAASLDEDGRTALPAIGDAPIEARAAIGPHATLDVMTNRPVVAVHSDQFVTLQKFVPAEATDYICRP
jgi:environmental stress-induced protein Ves